MASLSVGPAPATIVSQRAPKVDDRPLPQLTTAGRLELAPARSAALYFTTSVRLKLEVDEAHDDVEPVAALKRYLPLVERRSRSVYLL